MGESAMVRIRALVDKTALNKLETESNGGH